MLHARLPLPIKTCYNIIYCASSIMFQAIADPTTNLHQPADTPVSTMDHRAAGDKQVRANGPGSGELSPGMRRAPLAAAANWKCDGLCGNSFTGSHQWHQEGDAWGRTLHYCTHCTLLLTGWWQYPAQKRGIGPLYEICMKAREAAEAAEAKVSVEQNGGVNGSGASSSGGSTGAVDMQVG